MKKKFLHLGNHYIALHYNTNTMYMCVDNPKNYQVHVTQSAAEIENMESYLNAKEIPEELFVAKFSKVVSIIHSQTPYA